MSVICKIWFTQSVVTVTQPFALFLNNFANGFGIPIR